MFSTFQLGEAEDLQNLIDISKFHGLQGNTSQKCQKYILVHEWKPQAFIIDVIFSH